MGGNLPAAAIVAWAGRDVVGGDPATGHSLVTAGHRGRLVTAKPEGRSRKAARNLGERQGEMGAPQWTGRTEHVVYVVLCLACMPWPGWVA